MVIDDLKQYFTLTRRYRRAGPDNPLVQKVSLSELQALYNTTRSPRLKVAINSFLCGRQQESGAA